MTQVKVVSRGKLGHSDVKWQMANYFLLDLGKFTQSFYTIRFNKTYICIKGLHIQLTFYIIPCRMTDKDHNRPPKIGSIITYKFQEYTNSGTPRFPSYLGNYILNSLPLTFRPINIDVCIFWIKFVITFSFLYQI